MLSQDIFQEKKEVERLSVQNRLFSELEEPVYTNLLSGQSDQKVLDIGCNNGLKTVHRFSTPSVSKVIGLEYNESLAVQAQERYGNEKFCFVADDVEDKNFADRLRELMNRHGIAQFDVIYLSFVLMHLRRPQTLLTVLRQFLSPKGHLMIIEANDSASWLRSEHKELFSEFLVMLDKDPYAGKRNTGKTLCDTIAQCGYTDVNVWHDEIGARNSELQKKNDIFCTFFSYLSEDISILRSLYPEHLEYLSWEEWMKNNFETLKQAIVCESSEVSMGIKILTCARG